MRTRPIWSWVLVIPLFGFGCNGCNGTDKGGNELGEYEGDAAGECADGADNDRDGYFDCEDNGCWGFAGCEGYGNNSGGVTGGPTGGNGTTGGATGGVTGGTTGTGTGTQSCNLGICDLQTVDVSYRIDFDYWGLMEALFCDCYLQFEGSGTLYSQDLEVDVTNDGVADSHRIMFEGQWRATDFDTAGFDTSSLFTGTGCPPTPDPCTQLFLDAFWTDPSGDAYHSIYWDLGEVEVQDWFAHGGITGYSPSSNPVADKRFYITEMGESWDNSVPNPSINWTLFETRGDLFADLNHDLTISFGK